MSFCRELERRSGLRLCTKCRMGVGIVEDLESYLYEAWPEGRVMVLSTRECAPWLRDDRVAELRNVGLVLEQKIFEDERDYQSFVQESLGDGSTVGLSALFALGDMELFEACKEMASLLDLPCGVCLDKVPDERLFLCKDEGLRLELLMVELSGAARMSGEELAKSLYAVEGLAYLNSVDLIIQRLSSGAGSSQAHRCLSEVLGAVGGESDVIISGTEDGLIALSEAYAWLSAARRRYDIASSIDSVRLYTSASQSLSPPAVLGLIVFLSRKLSELVQIEAVQIDVDRLVQHRLPKEIHQRSVHQRLLGDGIALGKNSPISLEYEDRSALRARLGTLHSFWDELTTQLHDIAAALQALCTEIEDLRLNEVFAMDLGIEQICLHAADFAPKATLLVLLANLGLLSED
ncbi:MAG: hypothetical protein WC966_00525 [Bradymonadales bacterium]|jgi:hypothetical protein